MADDLTEKIYATWTTLSEAKLEPGALGVRELYRLLKSPRSELSHEQMRRLFSDPWLRKLYEMLKSDLATWTLPAVAAASDGDIYEREFEGGSLRIVEASPFAYISARFEAPHSRAIRLDFGPNAFLIFRHIDASGEAQEICELADESFVALLAALKDPTSSGVFIELDDEPQ